MQEHTLLYIIHSGASLLPDDASAMFPLQRAGESLVPTFTGQNKNNHPIKADVLCADEPLGTVVAAAF